MLSLSFFIKQAPESFIFCEYNRIPRARQRHYLLWDCIKVSSVVLCTFIFLLSKACYDTRRNTSSIFDPLANSFHEPCITTIKLHFVLVDGRNHLLYITISFLTRWQKLNKTTLFCLLNWQHRVWQLSNTQKTYSHMAPLFKVSLHLPPNAL